MLSAGVVSVVDKKRRSFSDFLCLAILLLHRPQISVQQGNQWAKVHTFVRIFGRMATYVGR